MPKIKQDEVLPMEEYKAVEHWKKMCTELLEALVLIKRNSSKGWIQDTATKAIKHFEENK